MQNALEQLASAGLLVDGAPELGSLVRCRVDGDRGAKRSGWYVLHEHTLDSGDRVVVGRYGNWKLYGDESLKVNFDASRLTVGERDRLRAEQQRLRDEAERERKRRAADAAKRAAQIFEKLPDSGTSEYLDRKKVRSFGLGFSRGSIVVPVRNSTGSLVGLQFIDGDGGKKFLTGTPKRGCFHLIGQVTPRAPLLVAEGYATAASIHMATGYPVAVAFDAGNLQPVAQALRGQFPNVDMVIAADNDACTAGNPGITRAREAALAVNGRMVWPEFEVAVCH